MVSFSLIRSKLMTSMHRHNSSCGLTRSINYSITVRGFFSYSSLVNFTMSGVNSYGRFNQSSNLLSYVIVIYLVVLPSELFSNWKNILVGHTSCSINLNWWIVLTLWLTRSQSEVAIGLPEFSYNSNEDCRGISFNEALLTRFAFFFPFLA